MAGHSSIAGDTEGDPLGTPKTGKKGVSLSAYVLAVFKAEPDRAFVIRDLVDRTGGKPETVKRILARLSSTGKGAGPVRRNEHGIYQYAPEKEQDNLQALTRSGNWKIENLAFVPLMVYPTPVSPIREPETMQKGTPPDTRVPTPKAGYPITLPTGQQIAWELYENGNQMIRISANGAPPLSPDTVLLIIQQLGIDDSWKCTSLELNLDSRKHRIDSSYSLQVIEGLLLKAYQHGYNARVEVADRRKVPVREVMDLFHAIAGGIDGKEVLAKVRQMEERVTRCEKSARLALNVATSVRDGQPSSTGHGGRRAKIPAPGFRTGAEIHKGKVT